MPQSKIDLVNKRDHVYDNVGHDTPMFRAFNNGLSRQTNETAVKLCVDNYLKTYFKFLLVVWGSSDFG